MGLVLDAGGPNAGLLKLLRKGEKVEGSWPRDSCLYSLNPMDPTRKIYHYHCSTHNQKSMRNSLHRSQTGGTRDFHRFTKHNRAVGFGWPEVADIYHRDEKRAKSGLVALTRMTMQAALLDQWSQMNVVFSKAPFQVTSIVEMMVHISQRLGCVNEFWKAKGNVSGDEAYEEMKLVACFDVIQQAVRPETEVGIQREILTLEYLLVIHRIFIIRLMNSKYNLNKNNIDEEEKRMMKIMEYFEEWMQEKEVYKKSQTKVGDEGERKRKREGESKSEKNATKRSIPTWRGYFLADLTHTNLRLGVAGFFGYARSVLNMEEGAPQYVPALHSNQSSIEALFSWIRKVGRDKASNYGGGISGRNAIRTNTAENVLANNKMYSKENISIEKDDSQVRELVLGKGLKEREKTLMAWLSSRKKYASVDFGVLILPVAMALERSDLGNLVLPVLREKRLDQHHFSDFLVEDTIFTEFAMLSMGGGSEDWFRRVCEGMKEEDENIFDDVCKLMLADIWECLRNSGSAKRNTVEASHQYQVHTYLQGLDKGSAFGIIINRFPLGLVNRHAACILCHRLSKFLFHNWIPESLESIRSIRGVTRPVAKVGENKEQSLAKTGDSEKEVDLTKEVNRFVGFAVSSLIKKTRMQFTGSKEPPKKVDVDELVGRLHLLKSMRVFEHEIMNDADYIADYYCSFHRLLNDGHLALVSPKYVGLGLSLLTVIANAVNDEQLKKNGHEPLRAAVASAKDPKGSLKLSFLELCNDDDELTMKQKGKLFDEIVDKTKNARGGAVIKRFRSNTTGRGAQSENSIAFRSEIKALAKKGRGGATKGAEIKLEWI